MQLYSASSDLLWVIVHSSQTINLHTCGILAIALFLAMLQIGVSLICMFNGNFKAECAVRPPSTRVAAIPDEANARATPFRDLILAKSNEIQNVFPVPPGASRK